MKRPPMMPSWRDGLLIAWVIAMLLSLPGVELKTEGKPEDDRAQHGEVRDVPMDQLRQRLEEGRLSDHRARWTQVLNPKRTERPAPELLPAPLRHILWSHPPAPETD